MDPANVEIAYRFDSVTQKFRQVVTTVTDAANQIANSVPLLPLEVVLVKSNAAHAAVLIFETSVTNPPNTTLSAGWNTIGLAVPLGTATKQLDQALVSANSDPSGGVGYTIVVSPSINPDSFVWTRGESAIGVDLARFLGYWVFMENADELAGFSSTPVNP
ncbi:MAG: hypothetical protein O2826_02680 [Chloroflexi bacterium]|nr:hypothetical protein [Chloroflexota bacterium]MDA1173405.1 hypothetical protein [Chloroflexota bacterium]